MRTRIGTVIICILSAVWLARSPDWEPLIAFVAAFGAYLGIEFTRRPSKEGNERDTNESSEIKAAVEAPKKEEKRFHKRPLAVHDCRWFDNVGAWVDSMGISYCHKCAVADIRSPMKRIGDNNYRCPICHNA